MVNDGPVEVPATTTVDGEGKRQLVDMSDPTVARTNGTPAAERRLSDPYGYSGEPPADAPAGAATGDVKLTDPYAYSGNPEAPIQLSEAAQKKIKETMDAYNKTVTEGNFSFGFKATEGPWNAITRLRTAAAAKQKSGAELSAEEKAVLSIPDADMVKESRRIRDRDFATYKENGDPRNFYKTTDKTQRYTDKEIAQMMKEKEAELRKAAETEAREQLAKEQEAEKQRLAEAERQRVEAENQRLEAERVAAENQRLEAERVQQEAEKQRQLEAAIEKYVPAQPIIQQALTQSEFVGGDAAAIRTSMKAFVTSEVQAGTLKPEDLARPVPRVGAAYIATGALTPQELTTALTEQARLQKEAAPGAAVPKLGEILEKTFKDNPEKMAKIKKASGFYDALKRLSEEARLREDAAKK